MLFNSYTFLLLFLPLVLAGCFALASRYPPGAAPWLVFASLVFYGWWDPRYVPLLAASVGFNCLAGRLIVSHEGRFARGILILAIATNIGILGYFKYAGFIATNVNTLFGMHLRPGEIVLPLGISFFTFTQIAYLVDMYREPARYRLVPYALFVTYFPHLVAGPILHHREMMPQFDQSSAFRFDSGNLAAGLAIFAIGLFKKVVLADGIAPHVSPVFDHSTHGYAPTLLEAWGATLGYGLQLYFDFSGYSDMAIGLSKMFGIRLPLNFASPYKATSIIEFWRRWHMTLSRFLRDYVYIPLGGSRRGTRRRYLSLFATMLLGGLWHGAAWTFVAWGALHGVLLAINHGWRALKDRIGVRAGSGPGWLGRGERTLGGLLTFVAVFAAWALFRAADMESARLILNGMAGMNGMAVPLQWLVEAADLVKIGVGGGYGTLLLGWLPEQVRQIAGGMPGDMIEGTKTSLLISKSQVLWIVALLLIVWFTPNTEQLMARADAIIPDRRAPCRPTVLCWTPSFAWAMATAALLTASFLSLARVSEFLYFRF
jgi:D-alanyl-lipoteichoic acid acyltransferase DltB (MBOAT superfamily)